MPQVGLEERDYEMIKKKYRRFTRMSKLTNGKLNWKANNLVHLDIFPKTKAKVLYDTVGFLTNVSPSSNDLYLIFAQWGCF